MNDRPRIGITRWEDVPGERLQSYRDRVHECGGDVIDLSGTHTNTSGIDGLVLTGGIDVAPARYGESPHPTVKRVDPERDAFELAVLLDALARDVPVLAICRGHQLLNVAFGGGLLQHIESGEHVAHLKTEGTPSQWHDVHVSEGSLLAAIIGSGEREVNSRHHQAVTDGSLATGLVAVAQSPDGLVEGIESLQHRWVVGVQWHPERSEHEHPAFAPMSRRLFEAFVRAASPVSQPA
jgi:putative glutamine amidotransferase